MTRAATPALQGRPEPPLPVQPADVPWPTTAWASGDLPSEAWAVAGEVAGALFDPAKGERYGQTHALLMVHRGHLVLERYDAETTRDDTLRSWSIAKSITHALVGLLVGDGQVDVHARALVAEWQAPGDPRAEITLEHLLRMTDGLAFQEDYLPGSQCNCIDMLFQSGKRDTARYARSRPAAHAPGQHWNYSSGSTNIVAAILGICVGEGRVGMERFMTERLFSPLGMSSAKPRFDASGTFIGSSYVFATARDFARFGLLYLRDGVWERRRILPEGWADHARTLTPASDGEYGAHWWLGRGGPGTFSAVGYEGQYLHLDPARDVVVLRLGVSSPEQRLRVEGELRRLVTCAPRL